MEVNDFEFMLNLRFVHINPESFIFLYKLYENLTIIHCLSNEWPLLHEKKASG